MNKDELKAIGCTSIEDLIHFLQGLFRQGFFEILEVIGIYYYVPDIFSSSRHN